MNEINKNRPHSQFLACVNAETVSMAAGMPVIYDFDVTNYNDGSAVKKPSSTNATQALNCVAGILLKDTDSTAVGRVQAYGFIQKMTYVRATRGASTDSWASQASIAKGVNLVVNTVADAVESTTAGTPVLIALGQSLASYASSASATSDSRVAITTTVKGFLRLM